MDQNTVINIISQAVSTMITVSAPVLIVATVVGVIIAIFQATTQINEQTMIFVPKILAVFVGLIIFGAWMLTQLSDYTTKLFDSILTYV